MRDSIIQVVIALVLITKSALGTMQKRVIGGKIAPVDKYHWAVSLKATLDELKISAGCGASILQTNGSIKWLITAAHCFHPSLGFKLINPKAWHVRVGLRKVDFKYEKHNLKEIIKDELKRFLNKAYRTLFGEDKFELSLEDLHIEEIFVHPKYKYPRLENDIALIKLVDPLPIHQLKNVNFIDLPNELLGTTWPKENSRCLVVGWGCTESGGLPSPIAKLAILDIMNNSKCEDSFMAPIDLNPETEFCAGYLNKNYGLCPGDSGSGLACIHDEKWRLAGIVSAAHTRTPGKFPALFTRVSSFKSWILSIVNGN